jgi:hypothetical protein
MFNATFNNISVISWWSVLLVKKTTDLPQVTDKLYLISHNVVLSTPRFELTTLVVIGTYCIGNYKSNYHTITMAPSSQKLPLNTGLIVVKYIHTTK